MNAQANILIIGMGNHARRIYIPTILKLSKNLPITVTGVDIENSRTSIENALSEKNLQLDTHYLEKVGDKLSPKARNQLTKLVENKKINGVIIATPPDSHKIYADWAIENGLHVLMDKPVSARKNSSTSESQAKKLITDYTDLTNKYEKVYKKHKNIFMLNTQRRYEVGFLHAFKLIQEATNKFNVPVTSIQAMHADGVWIFPEEVLTQQCHHYFDGYGKCSHSGFHLFDIVWQFYKTSYIKSKFADTAEVLTSFIEPRGTLKQFNQNDYVKLFGYEYKQVYSQTDQQLNAKFKNYGENDAFSIIRLLNRGDNVCNISINLLHNSISERSWIRPANDLYKGNGRIKHQQYIIQQGPFQSIHIHNYQSKGHQDNSTLNDYDLGGNNHFDIYVFRNPKMFGNKTKNLTKYSLKDLDADNNFDDSKLHHETTKEIIVNEFIDAVLGKINRSQVKADIGSYLMPVKIMSSIYQSNARYKKNKNPLVKFKINYHA